MRCIAHKPTTGLTLPMRNDPLAHTLTAQSMVLDPTPFDSSSLPANQSLPALHLASVQGNAGQSSYRYPLQVPPGTGGFTPQLSLSYSSAAPNERHNATSPAGDEGDGWSLNLGSISAEVYPTTPSTTWYFLNNVANVGDRLIPAATANYFDTEHLSYLRVQQINPGTDTTCFHVWDKAGTYYELGCTADSLQYWTDSNGTRYNYRWDVNKIVAPSEGPNSAYYKLILASYLQESVPTSGHTSIRDAALKQIIYGDGLGTTASVTDVAGTVDLLYHAPFDSTSTSGDSARVVSWATAYTTNYNCTTPPPVNTTWRCDDPLDNGSAHAPTVMSTMTLDHVYSYVGSDASSQAYQYDFSYVNGTVKDTPFGVCYDPYTLAQEYCAGEHLLMSVTPWVYQSTSGHPLRAVNFGYSSPLHNTYYDSLHKTTDNTQQYSGQTYWQYLNFYEDLTSGVGGRISYATAYNNTHGTPTVKSGNTVTDDRYDALYCTTHANDPDPSLRCTGNYGHPDDYAWSEQVVITITALGTDSSASSLQPATTTYGYYRLAKTGVYSGSGTWCYPDQYGSSGEQDCVGDNWLPSGDGDWLDYSHAEYQGLAQVWITSPAHDLTVDSSYSTEGWNTPMSDYQNFLGSMVYRQEVYSGTSYAPSTMLTRTDTTYATLSNACRSTIPTYPACETVILTTKATDFEGTNSSSALWVQHAYTYDDYSLQYGLVASGVYHLLQQDSISSANAPGLLKQWLYRPNDQTVGGWTYYTVDKATHSQVNDSTSHLWQCQDTTYDEGAGTGIPTPAAGLPTTVKTYSNSACTPTRGTPLTTSYQGYDAYGNAVASVDGVAAANSSLYTSNGCTLSTSPVIVSSAWSKSHYTACSVYDSYNAQPATATNALGQASSISYDYTQGALPTSATDANSQVTSTGYSYDGSGNRTIQVSLPLHSGSYTSQSSTASGCTSNSVTPCFEIDSKTYQYNTVSSSTFYDSLGRAVETRTPGPGSGDDTLVITTYNDQAHAVWQSVPFEITHGSGWVDPNNVKDYQNTAPGGTGTFFDALGRPLATQDPLYGSSQEPGITCSATLSGTYTACINDGLGSVSGDSNTYATVTTVDPNKHVRVSYLDALGRTVYTQQDSGRYGGGPTVNQRQNLQYNVLNELTQVKVIDKAPLSGQTITSATTTAQYDDLGRLTQVSDPDRGTHTYSYDANGRVLTDVSGTRTIGYNDDLLGRLGCVQDASPTINATGACSAGNQYVQNTYDTSHLTVSGTTDYPIGRLTQSVAKTYLPGGDTVTVTESYEHDARGRLQAAQLQFGTLPTDWNVTTQLPSYLAQYSFNDADQLTTTATSTNPSGQGYTTTQVYDTTLGSLYGLSNNGTATPNLATLIYNARSQVDTINFQTTTGSALAADQFSYDADLRPTSASATWQSGSGTSGTMLSQSRSYDPASNVISLSTTQAAVPGQSGSGGSESQNFCYDEQNRLVWAGNSGTQPGAGNGTCGTSTLSNSLSGASYSNSYIYTHLGQLWQGPLNGSGSQQQYLYCNSQPHELTGLYASGATCANQTGQVYASSYDSWGNVTSRTYSGTTATLSYDLLDHFVKWDAGTQNKDLYIYDASGARVLRRTTTSSGTTMTVYAFGLEEHSYFNTGGHKSKWNTLCAQNFDFS